MTVKKRPSAPVQFVDVSDQVGIRFKHNRGSTQYRAKDGTLKQTKFMPETVGSGCAFLDYDGDNSLDVFFVNSMDWPGHKDETSLPQLYRNDSSGSFKEVSNLAGVSREDYGMGCCVGDYDNDGWDDLYLTCIGRNRLYRNNGDGSYTEVTASAGVPGKSVEGVGLRWKWSSSCAWLDYDKDGDIDLFVCNYVKWSPETDIYCGEPGGPKKYCAPTNYEGVPSTLYRNEGDGHFTDVSDETGISNARGKSFGIAVADYNSDGWPDIAIANDLETNFLFLNYKGKRFVERGIEAGIGLSGTGHKKAGMGIDCADFKNNGRVGILIGNFANEALSLYDNDGKALFSDVAFEAGIGGPSLTFLTFGLFFFDYDLDGWKDAFIANGHIDDLISYYRSEISYQQRPLLYHNRGNGRFEEVGRRSGPPLSRKMVLRGCAQGDYDNDGAPDILVSWNHGKGMLWHNMGAEGRKWIRFTLVGRKSNRNGIGAKITVEAGGMKQSDTVKTGSSFLSQSDVRLTFGLGGSEKAGRVEVQWPSGARDTLTDIECNQTYIVHEGRGISRS